MGDLIKCRTESGYDVVDPETGVVLGEILRKTGTYVKPMWEIDVACISGTVMDGGLRRTLYRGVMGARHGETTIACMVDRVRRETYGFLRHLRMRLGHIYRPHPIEDVCLELLENGRRCGKTRKEHGGVA